MTVTLKTGLIDLKGVKVGRLKVLHRTAHKKGTRPKWRCECECGTRVTVSHNRLIDKKNPKTHCGCANRGPSSLWPKEYHAWWDAKNRCMNPNHPSYPSYGAKGIRMCPEWCESFEQFLKDVGEAPKPKRKYSLDRIDPHGFYEPGNVRWATITTQARNKKDTKWVQDIRPGYEGQRIKAAELAEKLGISYQQLRARMIDMGKWE